jgi:hypothetical protein
MKKIIIFSIAVFLAFAIIGCSNTNPEKKEIEHKQLENPTPREFSYETSDITEQTQTSKEEISKDATKIPTVDLTETHAEGDKLFADFWEATKTIRTEEHNLLWRPYSVDWNTFQKGIFLEYGICSEDYWENYLSDGLTMFEKFCWWSLYGNFISKVNAVESSGYFSDEKAFRNAFISLFAGGLKNYLEFYNNMDIYQDIIDPYEAIILWQYRYFLENGDFYNFMTGGTYLGRNTVVSSSLLDALKEDEKRQRQEEQAIERQFGETDENTQRIDDITREMRNEAERVNNNPLPSGDSSPTPSPAPIEIDTPTAEEKSGFGKLLDTLKNNAFSFSIAAIAFIVAGIIKLVKKNSSSREDDLDEDE